MSRDKTVLIAALSVSGKGLRAVSLICDASVVQGQIFSVPCIGLYLVFHMLSAHLLYIFFVCLVHVVS